MNVIIFLKIIINAITIKAVTILWLIKFHHDALVAKLLVTLQFTMELLMGFTMQFTTVTTIIRINNKAMTAINNMAMILKIMFKSFMAVN